MRNEPAIGDRFGKLTIVESAGKNKNGRRLWKCLCDCGNEKIALEKTMKNGMTASCGCNKKGIHTTHGKSGTHIYFIWRNMINRCYRSEDKYFANYGGRGITVCDRWHSFPCFYEDMGDIPDGKTLERIDNSKGYSKDNCTWATRIEQANNKRNNIKITSNGMTNSIAGWSRITGIKLSTIYMRMRSYKWEPEKAINYGRPL